MCHGVSAKKALHVFIQDRLPPHESAGLWRSSGEVLILMLSEALFQVSCETAFPVVAPPDTCGADSTFNMLTKAEN